MVPQMIASPSEDGDDCNDAEELQQLIDGEENPVGARTPKQDQHLLALTYALFAATADDLIKV